MTNEDEKRCSTCRFHRAETRNRIARLEPQDELAADLEQVVVEDEPERFLVCMHEQQSGKEVGYELDEPAPGSGCALWEAPASPGLSDGLKRLLERRGL